MYDIEVLRCGYILKYKEQIFKNFVYLFLTTLGLCCFALALSSCGAWASHCGGFSFCGAQESMEHRCASFSSCGSDRPSCPMACGIFPDQGLNPWLLHWQADSQPLDHQGRPKEQITVLKILTLTWIGGKMKMEIWRVIYSSYQSFSRTCFIRLKKEKQLSFTWKNFIKCTLSVIYHFICDGISEEDKFQSLLPGKWPDN